METLSIGIRYRPIRIGWCVRKNDFKALRESWRLNYTMWGGRFNPIIPIDESEFARTLIDLFRVDMLLPASDDPAIKQFIETFSYLPDPFHHDQLFVDRGNGTHSATILDIYHPIRHIYDEHFKNNPNPEPEVLIYEWEEHDSLSDVWLATSGAVPSKEVTGTDYTNMLERYLAAKRIKIDPKGQFPIGSNNSWTFGGIGRLDLKPHYSVMNHWSHPGFYIGNAGDFDDLVTYWNIRATNTFVLFFDPAHADRFDAVKSQWMENLRSRPKGRFESDNAIAIWGKDRDSKPDLTSFGAGLRICTADKYVWNGLNLKAPSMHFSEGSSLATVGAGTGQPRVSFQLPAKPFYEESKSHDQHFVISVDPGIGLFGNERATVDTPYIPELNEYYGRNFYFQWNRVRVEPDGFGVISSVSTSDLAITALDVGQLIENIFKVVGIVAKPSKPGLIASRLIQQMGGLQKCRPFKISGVRDLIEKFGPDKPFTHSGAVQTIRKVDSANGNMGFTEYENLFIEERPFNSKLSPDAVLAYLMKKNIFRAGLEFGCPSCRLQFWTSLDDISTETTCEYCGHSFNITPYLRHRGDWRFRRSGLFGRNDNQEGAIPVVLTLQQLDTAFNSQDMLYTTAMELSSGAAHIQKCETDFVVLVQSRRDLRSQIAIGECKTRKPITKDDVEKLKSVAMAFPSGRFDVFIIFSKLASFTQDEIDCAATLNDQYHRRVILLTERELEPYYLYEKTEKEFDIRAHAGSFEDMANVTHEIYFK